MEIHCRGEKLILSAGRAVYWPKQRALILADMHLGKTGYFRSRGVPIPSTVMADDLQALSKLIDQFRPEKIIIAGDMFHHGYNADITRFKEWREQYPELKLVLVPGNHDRLLKIDYERLGIELTAPRYHLSPFVIAHHLPKVQEEGFFISAHVHPGYILKGRGKQSVRLPCYIVSPRHMIMPAFSRFTGLYTRHSILESHQYYLIGADEVFCV